MPSYSIEVEPIAHARITGRLGTVIAVYRGVTWRIPLGGHDVTRNGHPAGWDMVPPAVYAFAKRHYDTLCRAVIDNAD